MPDLSASPVRLARKRLGLSLQKLSDSLGVQYQLVYLTECGCYTEIPPVILVFLAKEGFSVGKLEEDYNKFVQKQRRAFGETYFPRDFELPDPAASQNPLTLLRKKLDLNKAAFAKGLCIQPAVLYKIETGQQRTLALQIKVALVEAGLPWVEMKELESRYEEYYDRRHFKLKL